MRLHGAPLGVVEVELPVDEDGLGARARDELGPAIARHESADGPSPPRCMREREAFAARAPATTVVVATRDRPAALASTLRDLEALHYPRFDVVVDNAPSSDDARAVVHRSADTLDVRYLREDLPRLAVAHDAGLAQADGDVVAFTDDDVGVDPLQARAVRHACEAGCPAYHVGETGSSSTLAQFKTRFGAVAHPYAECRLERVLLTAADRALRRTVKRAIRFRDPT